MVKGSYRVKMWRNQFQTECSWQSEYWSDAMIAIYNVLMWKYFPYLDMDPEHSLFNIVAAKDIISIFCSFFSDFLPISSCVLYLDMYHEPWAQPLQHHGNGEYHSHFWLVFSDFLGIFFLLFWQFSSTVSTIVCSISTIPYLSIIYCARGLLQAWQIWVLFLQNYFSSQMFICICMHKLIIFH